MAVTPKLTHEPRPLAFEAERLRAVFYGDPGVGKTTLAMTFPRPLIIDTDGGTISATLQGLAGDTWEPEGWRDLQALYWWVKSKEGQFDTLVIDSMTLLQRLLLDEIVDMTAEKKAPNMPVMEFTPEISMYQANQRQISRILTEFRRLGKNMVLTAGVRERMGKRGPDVAPGLFTIISHWASVMGELVVQTREPDPGGLDKDGQPVTVKGRLLAKEIRVLHTAPSSDREAKSRYRSLLPGVIDPTYPAIQKKVNAEYAAALAQTKKTGAA